jgi:MOSC domain-containing protein YiiM
MFTGRVVSIFIAPRTGQATTRVEQARAVPGKGLEGDRYFAETGRYSQKPGPDRQITLIASEALEALEQERDIHLEPGETRRNLLTRGVPLNDLVGRQFKVGAVTLQGIKLCEPCSYLESQTQPGVLAGLTHRGGLRAEIITQGVIRVGDEIMPIP